jgi:ATP adenylyltransferase
MFEQGTLSALVTAATERAKASGALVPIATNTVAVDDHDMRFFIRVVAGFQRKDEARKEQRTAEERGAKVNPFLPPEKALTVADVSETHIAVLNKFNVVDRHLLIVTREFEHQETLLTLRDIEALHFCMREYDSLGFYNGGREAGASQEHKHLQLVPLPLTPEGPAIALEPLLPASRVDELATIPAIPFKHAFVRYNFKSAAPHMFGLYAAMLNRLGMSAPTANNLVRQSGPYCFLATKEWMLLVPRTKEFFEDISFNSLAFVGSLYIRDEQQLERLKTFGPMNALATVTLPH